MEYRLESRAFTQPLQASCWRCSFPCVCRTQGGLESPLHSLEHALHPWVAFGILPLFAFFNAGVPLSGLSLTDLLHPVPLGIMLGLFVGKQSGIVAASLVAVGVGITSLPEDIRWAQLYGTAVLCGIGFTMSLFIGSSISSKVTSRTLDWSGWGLWPARYLPGSNGYIVFQFFLDRTKAIRQIVGSTAQVSRQSTRSICKLSLLLCARAIMHEG